MQFEHVKAKFSLLGKVQVAKSSLVPSPSVAPVTKFSCINNVVSLILSIANLVPLNFYNLLPCCQQCVVVTLANHKTVSFNRPLIVGIWYSKRPTVYKVEMFTQAQKTDGKLITWNDTWASSSFLCLFPSSCLSHFTLITSLCHQHTVVDCMWPSTL